MQQTAYPHESPLRYHPTYEVLEDSARQQREHLQYTLRRLSETSYRASSHIARSVHSQSHGLIYAEMAIYQDLPPNLAQGMFAAARQLPLVMRFSTVPGDILNDRRCTPRSLAIKILGVEGERLPGSEHAITQDFLFVNGASFLSCSVQRFLANLQRLAATDHTPEFKQFLSQILHATASLTDAFSGHHGCVPLPAGCRETNILGETYFSQDPVLYGQFMAKIALVPIAGELLSLTNRPIDSTFASDGLKKSIVDFFKVHTAVWELRVQLCTDIHTMPIEDSSVIWSPDASPYIPVARITAKPQIAWSPYRSRVVDEGMTFSPWHGIQSHRPLGSVVQLRKMSYEMAKKQTMAQADIQRHEPTHLDDLC